MATLPVVPGDECRRARARFGYQLGRYNGTSHMRLQAPARKPLTLPRHRELNARTLRTVFAPQGQADGFPTHWPADDRRRGTVGSVVEARQ